MLVTNSDLHECLEILNGMRKNTLKFLVRDNIWVPRSSCRQIKTVTAEKTILIAVRPVPLSIHSIHYKPESSRKIKDVCSGVKDVYNHINIAFWLQTSSRSRSQAVGLSCAIVTGTNFSYASRVTFATEKSFTLGASMFAKNSSRFVFPRIEHFFFSQIHKRSNLNFK
ncbi:hypothetical protein YC2023_102831 [Brassica napus]